MEDAGVAPARIDELEAQAAGEVDAAVEAALASPKPVPGAELENVYAPAAWLTPGRLS